MDSVLRRFQQVFLRLAVQLLERLERLSSSLEEPEAETDIVQQRVEQLRGQPVIVEAVRADGSTTMWIGRLVDKTDDVTILVDASFIGSTGRRHLFLGPGLAPPYPDDEEDKERYARLVESGATWSADRHGEWEPHPDGVEIIIEEDILWWGAWTNDLTYIREAF